MSAVTVMLLAWGCLILAHWANSKPTVSISQVIQMSFAILLISFMDGNANTAPIAMGFAWLFLAAVLLSNGSILNSLAKAESVPVPAKKVKK